MQSAEVDARGSRIEIRYCTKSHENSTAFITPEALQTRQALQVLQALLAYEAMQALLSLVLHLMDNDHDRDFRTPDIQIPEFPKHGFYTPTIKNLLILTRNICCNEPLPRIPVAMTLIPIILTITD